MRKASVMRQTNSSLGGSWILTCKDFDFSEVRFAGFDADGVWSCGGGIVC